MCLDLWRLAYCSLSNRPFYNDLCQCKGYNSCCILILFITNTLCYTYTLWLLIHTKPPLMHGCIIFKSINSLKMKYLTQGYCYCLIVKNTIRIFHAACLCLRIATTYFPQITLVFLPRQIHISMTWYRTCCKHHIFAIKYICDVCPPLACVAPSPPTKCLVRSIFSHVYFSNKLDVKWRLAPR